MDFIDDGTTNGVAKTLITKKQAEKAIRMVKAIRPLHKTARLTLPTDLGQTTHLTDGVDLTKISVKGPIPFRFILVGMRSAIGQFAAKVLS
jgi:hypothetical protein